MMRYVFVFVFGIVFSAIPAHAVWLNVYYEIETPIVRVKVPLTKSELVTATVKSVMDKADAGTAHFDVCWKNDFLESINDIAQEPELLANGYTRYYSWCFALNGEVKDSAWTDTYVLKKSDEIDLFWGYMDGAVIEGNFTGDRYCKPISAALKDPNSNNNKTK